MNTASTPPTPAPRRSLFNRMTMIAFVAGAAVAAGVAAIASGGGMGMRHFGMMMGGPHGAANISAHVDHALKHLYVEINATESQQAQIAPLVKQAVNDLLPLRASSQAAHAQAVQALTDTSIDRNALEAARLAHLQLADQASKRVVQLIADIGDVLTPAQRVALAARMKQMRSRFGS